MTASTCACVAALSPTRKPRTESGVGTLSSCLAPGKKSASYLRPGSGAGGVEGTGTCASAGAEIRAAAERKGRTMEKPPVREAMVQILRRGAAAGVTCPWWLG